MDPDYCQSSLPVYAMGGSAAAISLFFLAMSQAKAHKQSNAVYYQGFALFLTISSAIMARQFYLGRQDPVVSSSRRDATRIFDLFYLICSNVSLYLLGRYIQ